LRQRRVAAQLDRAPERAPEFLDRLVTKAGIERERLLEDALDLVGDLDAFFARRWPTQRIERRPHHRLVVPDYHGVTLDDLDQGQRQPPNIRPCARLTEALGHPLFWRAVGRAERRLTAGLTG